MSDPVCPFAVQHILHGEEDRRPTIIPIATALHIAVTTASGDSLGRYFDREAVKEDSTFYVELDGKLYQFGPVNRQANAQFSGNAFTAKGRRYGAVSIETAGMGGPLTTKQLVTLSKLYAWLHVEWGISLDVSTEWNGPGAGWHSKYPEWNRNAHACPGEERVRQLVHVILPRARELVAPPAPPTPTIAPVTDPEESFVRHESVFTVPSPDKDGRQVVTVDGVRWSKFVAVSVCAAHEGRPTDGVTVQPFAHNPEQGQDQLALAFHGDPGRKVRLVIATV